MVKWYFGTVGPGCQFVPVYDVRQHIMVSGIQQEFGEVGPVEAVCRWADNYWVCISCTQHGDCPTPELQEVCIG